MGKAQNIIFEDVELIISRIKNTLKLLEGKKILVTGAAGLIPSYFLDTIYLLNKKYFTKKCELTAYNHHNIDENNRLFYLKGDKNIFFKTVDVSKAYEIEAGYDYIIHAASKASPGDYIKNPIETIDANVKGSETILKYMLKNQVKSYLYLSSGEIYGNPPSEMIPTRESYIGSTNHLSERSCYVESKRFSETMAINYFKKYNIPVKLVRPVHVYGPGIRLNDGRVWAHFIKNAYEGKAITILSDGKASRGFCYISDAMVQLWDVLLLGKNGQVYNIGNDSEEISIKELAKIIAELFDKNIRISIENRDVLYLKDSPRRSCPNMTKTFTEFDLKNKISIKEGLERTIKWVKLFYKTNHYD